MAKIDLISKKWCDLVFEGRCQRYGAYLMRANAGRWYGYALVVVVAFSLLFVFLPFVVGRYIENVWDKVVRTEVSELSQLPHPIKEDPALKHIPMELPPRLKVLKKSIRFVPQISEDGEDEAISGLEQESFSEIVENETARDLEEKKGTLNGDSVASDMLFFSDEVPELPQFPGGLGALMKWLDQNVDYPVLCRQRKIEGEVKVSFIVGTDGMAREPQIVQHSNRLFEQEALSVVRRMPKWKPGLVNGKPSPVRVIVPIRFMID